MENRTINFLSFILHEVSLSVKCKMYTMKEMCRINILLTIAVFTLSKILPQSENIFKKELKKIKNTEHGSCETVKAKNNL